MFTARRHRSVTCLRELLLHRPTTGKASVESSSLEPANCTELPMAGDGSPHGCSLCTSLYHKFGNITKSLKTNDRKAERRRAGGGDAKFVLFLPDSDKFVLAVPQVLWGRRETATGQHREPSPSRCTHGTSEGRST